MVDDEGDCYVDDKYQPLTLRDIDSYRVDPGLQDFLERKRAEAGVPRHEFRVLDFGCGRGQSVALLRRQGWQAYGLEVDEQWIRYAEPGLREAGLYEPGLLRIGKNAGGPGFDDGFFHLVYSSSVFEHVLDLPAAVGDITRMTTAGGWGYHWFIGRWSPVERHLDMPLVHWLPKNRLRWCMVAAAVLAGKEPGWKAVAAMDFWQRVNVYYDYSVRETIYRPVTAYQNAFIDAGQQVELEVLNHPRLRGSRLSALNQIPGGKRMLEALCTTFKIVIVSTQKPATA